MHPHPQILIDPYRWNRAYDFTTPFEQYSFIHGTDIVALSYNPVNTTEYGLAWCQLNPLRIDSNHEGIIDYTRAQCANRRCRNRPEWRVDDLLVCMDCRDNLSNIFVQGNVAEYTEHIGGKITSCICIRVDDHFVAARMRIISLSAHW